MCKLCNGMGWIQKWRFERMYGTKNHYAVRCPNGCSSTRNTHHEPSAPLFDYAEQVQVIQ